MQNLPSTDGLTFSFSYQAKISDHGDVTMDASVAHDSRVPHAQS